MHLIWSSLSGIKDLSYIFALLTVIIVSSTEAKCPLLCSCDPREERIVCRGGQIQKILPGVTSNLQRLTLEQVAGVKNITNDIINNLHFNSNKVSKLKISDCSVLDIGPGAFVSLESLKELDLSRNELSSLNSKAFQGLSGLKYLNLSSNKITELKDLFNDLPNLVNLDLSLNYVQDIPSETFAGQSSLTFLKLDGNSFKQLHGYSFNGLDKITDLNLRDCNILSIDDDFFSSVPRLKQIDLGNNRLNNFPLASNLKKFINLKVLLFSYNSLQKLENSHFEGLHLHHLDLSSNDISSIDNETFKNAKLEQLSLADNQILSLHDETFDPLGKDLTILNLAGNKLKDFSQNIFKDLKLLTFLNISNCFLNDLKHETLYPLLKLKRLDVSHNNLHFLSKEVLLYFENLKTVNLHENPWICDCEIKPLHNWSLKAINIAKTKCPYSSPESGICSNLRCEAPSQFLHVSISQLRDSIFEECHENEDSSDLPKSTQWAIVGSCFGFAVILLAITIYLWKRGRTGEGLRKVCVPSNAQSSHAMEDGGKIPPLSSDRASLNESDHSFVFRNYFDQMVTDPKLMSRTSDSEEPTSPKERDSLYSSQPDLYDAEPNEITIGIESTV